jgi:Cof subfamily protein (haloacid dehalogenase superfamily)
MAMDQTIPQSAVEACRSARKNGHLLYICSGRQAIEIPRHVRHIGFDGVVSAGGAHIDADGQTIFQAFIDRGTVTRIVDYLRARREAFALDLPDRKISTPALWALMESAFRSFTAATPEKSVTEKLAADKAAAHKTAADKADGGRANEIQKIIADGVSRKKAAFYRDDVQKIIFVGHSGSFDEVWKQFGGECEIFRGSIPILGKDSGEISPLGVHKGSAVEIVAHHHGIPVSDTIAIGDSDNDRPMIERAGIGVAMGNASDELKTIAGYVTARLEDDGIMRVFKDFALV